MLCAEDKHYTLLVSGLREFPRHLEPDLAQYGRGVARTAAMSPARDGVKN